MQRPAQHNFAHPVGVNVGGVKEIDPHLQGALNIWTALFLIQDPRIALGRLAVAHTAQANAGYFYAGVTQSNVLHSLLLP